MHIVSRRDFGYENDEFEGYVVIKDDTPIFQHHLYHDYYSVFWRGSATLEALTSCLAESVAEIREKLREPFYRLNSGTALIVSGQELLRIPFQIERGLEGERVLLSGPGFEEQVGSQSQITFARFDIESSLSLPIILWGDLDNEENSEVGFSTTAELPDAVLQLLKRTCFENITDSDLEEIRGHVFDHTPVVVF